MSDTKPIVIGLSGFYGSGKDTLAEQIVEQDPSFVHMSFADPVLDIARASHPDQLLWNRESWDTLKQDAANRNFVVNLGESIRDTLGSEVFALNVVDRIYEAQDRGQNVVISDVRLPVEHYNLRKHFDDEFTNYRLAIVDSPLQDLRLSRMNVSHLRFSHHATFYSAHRISAFRDSVLSAFILFRSANDLLRLARGTLDEETQDWHTAAVLDYRKRYYHLADSEA